MTLAKRMVVTLWMVGCLVAAGGWPGSLLAATVWTGSGNWHADSGNWSAGVPGEGDDAVIDGTCTLSADSAALSSLVVSNGATLTFDNWDTRLEATSVTVEGGGVITHTPSDITPDAGNTNRIHIVCVNLTVDSTGSISASGKGYQAQYQTTGQGPGGGEGDGANRAGSGGHGGLGGNGQSDPTSTSFNAGGRTYGSRNEPNTLGSAGGGVSGGASNGGAGGGVVRIEASGTVEVNGGIYATGYNAPLLHTDAAGAGGSIFIYCNTFAGSGAIRANGGSSGNYGGGGGGGRVAVWSVTDNWQGAISASKGGNKDGQPEGFDGTVVRGALDAYGDPVPASPNEWSGYEYYITADASRRRWDSSTNWSQWHSPVAGEDVLIYTHGSDAAVMVDSPPRLGVVSVTNATLWFVNWGTQLSANEVVVRNNGSLRHGSCSTSPSSTRTSRVYVVCGTFTLDEGGSVNADALGWRGGYDETAGEGTGGGGPGAGGGYGGAGGISWGGDDDGGKPYGSETTPVGPGSGGGGKGGGSIWGGDGGGSVWIEVPRGVATINGTVSANGEYGPGDWTAGGGSGGAIYLSCRTLEGTGSLNVNGGGSTRGGGGGGGRIAVWRTFDNWGGSESATGGTGADANRTGGDGSVNFYLLPTSSLFIIK